MRTFTCLYCTRTKTEKVVDGEHFIPEACGGNITSKDVCNECNTWSNQEVDEKYSKLPPVIWCRTLLGIEGKRKFENDFNKKIEISGDSFNLNLSPNGFDLKLIPIPIYDENNNTISIKCNEDDLEKAINAAKKAANRNNAEVNSPEVVEKMSIPEGMVITEKVNVDILKKEHCKILMGFGCNYINNFTQSGTYEHLRQYFKLNTPLHNLTHHFAMVGNLFEEGLNLNTYLNENGYHLVGFIRKNDGKVRLFCMLFGYLFSFVDTEEKFDEKVSSYLIIIDPRKNAKTLYEGPYKKGCNQYIDKFVPQILALIVSKGFGNI